MISLNGELLKQSRFITFNTFVDVNDIFSIIKISHTKTNKTRYVIVVISMIGIMLGKLVEFLIKMLYVHFVNSLGFFGVVLLMCIL